MQSLTAQLRDVQASADSRKAQLTALEEALSKVRTEKEELSTALLSHKDASSVSDSRYQQLRDQFSQMEQKAKIAEHQVEVTASALKLAEQNNDTLQKLLESTSTKLATIEQAFTKLKDQHSDVLMEHQVAVDKLRKQLESSLE